MFAAQPSPCRASRVVHRRVSAMASSCAQPKLYSNPRSRSQVISWFALEFNVPLQEVELNMSAGEHKRPDYLAVHPFGKVPALVCPDGTPVFESGAILSYLADKFGGLNTPEKRAHQMSWVVWANATLAPAAFGPTRVQALPGFLDPLNALLSKQPWLTGNDFAVSDVAVGAYLVRAMSSFTAAVRLCCLLTCIAGLHSDVLSSDELQQVAGRGGVHAAHLQAPAL